MRNTINFDWRWIVAIILILTLVSTPGLPWPVLALLLLGGGGFFIYQSFQQVGLRVNLSGKRETYWRGQRVELQTNRRPNLRMPRGRQLTPFLISLIFGSLLAIAGLSVALRGLGLA